MTSILDGPGPSIDRQLSDEEQEAKFRAEIAEGDQARRLLADPALQRWMQQCERDIIGEFVAADDTDTDAVMKAKHDYSALGRVFYKLHEAVETHKMATQGLQSLKKKRETVRKKKAQLRADFDADTDYSEVGTP